MAQEALRVISLAYKDSKDLSEDKLTFVGMVGMKDPIRPEAKKAVETLKKAGIKIVL